MKSPAPVKTPVPEASAAGRSMKENKGIAVPADRRAEAVFQRKVQAMADSFTGKNTTVQRAVHPGGLPAPLKAGIENLSGHSLDDVKVHYNSPQPAKLQAHAYAQGSNIHLAPGQEKHLPHEAWHVVQQKQGRVQPTMQLKKTAVNDDPGLEKEADVMGAKALQGKFEAPGELKHTLPSNATVQGVFTVKGKDVHRPILDRVDNYLARVKPQLQNEFNEMVIDQDSDYGELSEWLESKGLDSSIVGNAKNEDSVFIQGIGEMIKEIAQKLNVKDENIYAIIIDLDIHGGLAKAEKEMETREFKKRTTDIVKNGWQFWTSCFDTSLRLYQMLGAVPVMGMAQVGGNGGLLSFAMSELCSQIESIATEKLGAVFRVNIGDADHSFTIVVQGDKAEIVQSFAGGEGESLLTNIGGKNVYSIGEITTHLMNIEKPKGEREASANKIFGGNIMLEKGGKDLWPNVSLSWHMSTLHPAKHIFQLLAEKISLNLKALQKLGLAK